MSLKKVILLLATGVSTGAVCCAAITQSQLRVSATGGELFFIPMVILLVWFGWMLKGESRKIGKVRRKKK